MQFLHHSTTHDFNCVSLSIGCLSSRMLIGIWIKYDAMIKAAHQRFSDIDYAMDLNDLMCTLMIMPKI